jgi:predicted RNA-binding Zn-ribbon protein involved in translation (DUF1610 family)
MQIKFYCESCGEQVPINVERCPHCRREFFAVMCPLCKYEALPREFRQGCPSCGYMSRRMKIKIKEKQKQEKKKKKTWIQSLRKKGKNVHIPLSWYRFAVTLLIMSIIGLIILIALTAK